MKAPVDGRAPVAWSCFSALDRSPVPLAVEDASEATWREFDACCEALEIRVRDRFGGTAPRPPRGPAARPDASGLGAAARQELDRLMRLARLNDRICPVAPDWKKLHQILCVLLQRRSGEPAPAPVAAQQWAETTELQKRLRLREQLAWAQCQGGLGVAGAFLQSLPEDHWDHHTPATWPTL